jgi:hypothetical protein
MFRCFRKHKPKAISTTEPPRECEFQERFQYEKYWREMPSQGEPYYELTRDDIMNLLMSYGVHYSGSNKFHGKNFHEFGVLTERLSELTGYLINLNVDMTRIKLCPGPPGIVEEL